MYILYYYIIISQYITQTGAKDHSGQDGGSGDEDRSHPI